MSSREMGRFFFLALLVAVAKAAEDASQEAEYVYQPVKTAQPEAEKIRISRSIGNIARLLLGGNVPPDHPLVKYPDPILSASSVPQNVIAAVPGMTGAVQEGSRPQNQHQVQQQYQQPIASGDAPIPSIVQPQYGTNAHPFGNQAVVQSQPQPQAQPQSQSNYGQPAYSQPQQGYQTSQWQNNAASGGVNFPGAPIDPDTRNSSPDSSTNPSSASFSTGQQQFTQQAPSSAGNYAGNSYNAAPQSFGPQQSAGQAPGNAQPAQYGGYGAPTGGQFGSGPQNGNAGGSSGGGGYQQPQQAPAPQTFGQQQQQQQQPTFGANQQPAPGYGPPSYASQQPVQNPSQNYQSPPSAGQFGSAPSGNSVGGQTFGSYSRQPDPLTSNQPNGYNSPGNSLNGMIAQSSNQYGVPAQQNNFNAYSTLPNNNFQPPQGSSYAPSNAPVSNFNNQPSPSYNNNNQGNTFNAPAAAAPSFNSYAPPPPQPSSAPAYQTPGIYGPPPVQASAVPSSYSNAPVNSYNSYAPQSPSSSFGGPSPPSSYGNQSPPSASSYSSPSLSTGGYGSAPSQSSSYGQGYNNNAGQAGSGYNNAGQSGSGSGYGSSAGQSGSGYNNAAPSLAGSGYGSNAGQSSSGYGSNAGQSSSSYNNNAAPSGPAYNSNAGQSNSGYNNNAGQSGSGYNNNAGQSGSNSYLPPSSPVEASTPPSTSYGGPSPSPASGGYLSPPIPASNQPSNSYGGYNAPTTAAPPKSYVQQSYPSLPAQGGYSYPAASSDYGVPLAEPLDTYEPQGAYGAPTQATPPADSYQKPRDQGWRKEQSKDAVDSYRPSYSAPSGSYSSAKPTSDPYALRGSYNRGDYASPSTTTYPTGPPRYYSKGRSKGYGKHGRNKAQSSAEYVYSTIKTPYEDAPSYRAPPSVYKGYKKETPSYYRSSEPSRYSAPQSDYVENEYRRSTSKSLRYSPSPAPAHSSNGRSSRRHSSSKSRPAHSHSPKREGLLVDDSLERFTGLTVSRNSRSPVMDYADSPIDKQGLPVKDPKVIPSLAIFHTSYIQ